MPWQNGVFQRKYSWVADAAAGFDILAARMDDDTDDIVAGLNNCVTLDGQNVLTSLTLHGPMAVTGRATLSGGAAVTGGLTTDTLAVTNGATITNPTGPGLQVTSGIIADGLDVNTTDGITDAGPLVITGQSRLNGGAVVAGGLTADAMQTSGAAVIGGNLTVTGAGGITANAGVTCGSFESTGVAVIGGNLTVTGAGGISTSFGVSCGSFESTGVATIGGNLTVTGAGGISVPAPAGVTCGVIDCTGAATIGGNLTVSGGFSAPGGATVDRLTCSNAATVGGALTVTGAGNAALNVTGGGITVAGVVTAAQVACSGSATFGGLHVTGGLGTTLGATGITGGLTTDSFHATASANFDGTVGMSGALTVDGNVGIGGALTQSGQAAFSAGVQINGVVPTSTYMLIVSGGSIDVGTDGLFGGTVTAAAFNPPCSLEIKRDVKDLDVKALELIRGAAAKSYRRKTGPDREEWGFLAEELAELSNGVLGDGKTVSLLPLVAVLWKAVQELSGAG